MERQVEEALYHRADPLHLAIVFGVVEKTALRYANPLRRRRPRSPRVVGRGAPDQDGELLPP
jgi:hypothetical protein